MMWQALVYGMTLGLGIVLVLAWVRARRATLEARIAPFVRESLTDEVRRRHVAVTPFPTLERLIAPAARDVARVLDRWGSRSADIAGRLRRAGSPLTVEQFRAQQVVWAVAALALGCVVSAFLAVARSASVFALVVLVVVMTVGAAVARDAVLTRAVKRRERRMLAELPTIAELLALAVAAGESATGALERVARTTSGDLTDELGRALAEVRAGARLPVALSAMAADSRVPALQRFAEGIGTAVERGTPLAEVLRAQAQDVRAQGRQALVEEGGRREIAMMIPVVFLILPVTVVFAVFPGLVAINLGA